MADLNIQKNGKEQITRLIKALWKSTVAYLGIRVASTLETETLINLNLLPIIKDVRNQFESWQKLRISWFGKVAVIKMKVLPRFTHTFQNLILPLPLKILSKIQGMFSKFVWVREKQEQRDQQCIRTNHGEESHFQIVDSLYNI